MRGRRRLRAVTFDCWNTLIRERSFEASRRLRAEALAAEAASAGLGLDLAAAAELVRAAHARHIDLWARGVGSGPREMAAWALEAVGIVEAARVTRVAQGFEEAGLANEIAALDGAGETLERLAARSVRIGLVCDTGFSTGRIVRRFLERAGLLAGLEVLVFSDELGVPKPHRRMFEAALGPLGADASEAVHVGDLRPTDVAGGRGFGMGTIRIRDAHDDRSELPDADAVADTHAAVLALLDEW